MILKCFINSNETVSGKEYLILEMDKGSGKLQIQGESGQRVWLYASFFDIVF